VRERAAPNGHEARIQGLATASRALVERAIPSASTSLIGRAWKPCEAETDPEFQKRIGAAVADTQTPMVSHAALYHARPACAITPASRVPNFRQHVDRDSMFRGWGAEVDGDEHATLNQHRETAVGEAGADEIEQGSPCLVRR
jgi:hypothetical protein